MTETTGWLDGEPIGTRAQMRSVDVWSTQEHYTGGNYDTEIASVTAFDHLIKQLDCFLVLREVTGQYLQMNLHQPTQRPRIDRILIPTPQFRQLGWQHGVIGVECKRTGEKIGRPISQMLDYRRAVFPIGAAHVVLDYVMLWPWAGCGGPVASILAQQRLGNISSYGRSVSFKSGHLALARLTVGEPPQLCSNPQGRKVGSR